MSYSIYLCFQTNSTKCTWCPIIESYCFQSKTVEQQYSQRCRFTIDWFFFLFQEFSNKGIEEHSIFINYTKFWRVKNTHDFCHCICYGGNFRKYVGWNSMLTKYFRTTKKFIYWNLLIRKIYLIYQHSFCFFLKSHMHILSQIFLNKNLISTT